MPEELPPFHLSQRHLGPKMTRFENEKKSADVKLLRNDLTRPHLCEAKSVEAATSITHPNLQPILCGGVAFWVSGYSPGFDKKKTRRRMCGIKNMI